MVDESDKQWLVRMKVEFVQQGLVRKNRKIFKNMCLANTRYHRCIHPRVVLFSKAIAFTVFTNNKQVASAAYLNKLL